jgi:hypothetical protein
MAFMGKFKCVIEKNRIEQIHLKPRSYSIELQAASQQTWFNGYPENLVIWVEM